jgi:caffeoyl-CoA O-methyltransferase
VIAKYLTMSDDLHRYVVDHSTARDDALLEIERETEALGDVAVMQMAPEQGALFTLITAAMNARLAVEVGTFTGYGAVCIARGLAPGGRLICCEIDPERAAVARRSLERAGVADRATVEVGPAIDTLRALPADEPIDFAFVDADKPAYGDYFDELLPRMAPNGLIALDNVLMSGRVLDPDPDDASAVALHELNERLARDPGVEVAMVAIADGISFVRRSAA